MYQQPPHRNEMHIRITFNGHHSSVDCWCEPTAIYWRKNHQGIPFLVVEHNDEEDLTIHRSGIIHARDRAQDWVTRYLEAVNPFPPPEEKLP